MVWQDCLARARCRNSANAECRRKCCGREWSAAVGRDANLRLVWRHREAVQSGTSCAEGFKSCIPGPSLKSKRKTRRWDSRHAEHPARQRTHTHASSLELCCHATASNHGDMLKIALWRFRLGTAKRFPTLLRH